MDFPIRKTCSMDLFTKTFVFADSSIFTGPRKPTSFPTIGPKEHLHRHCHQASKVSSCGGHLYHGQATWREKGYGHLTMMRNPSDDYINPYNGYKWWLNNGISLIQSSISASLWMRSARFVYFPPIPIPIPSLCSTFRTPAQVRRTTSFCYD